MATLQCDSNAASVLAFTFACIAGLNSNANANTRRSRPTDCCRLTRAGSESALIGTAKPVHPQSTPKTRMASPCFGQQPCRPASQHLRSSVLTATDQTVHQRHKQPVSTSLAKFLVVAIFIFVSRSKFSRLLWSTYQIPKKFVPPKKILP